MSEKRWFLIHRTWHKGIKGLFFRNSFLEIMDNGKLYKTAGEAIEVWKKTKGCDVQVCETIYG